MKDMHKNIKVINAIAPKAVGTTGAGNGVISAAIDRQGYESVEFLFNAGASATVADTVTPAILEGDTTNGSFTSVAAADLIGDETAVTLATAAGQGKGIGYRGNSRYLKIRLFGTGTATALVAAMAVLGNPHKAPVAT